MMKITRRQLRQIIIEESRLQAGNGNTDHVHTEMIQEAIMVSLSPIITPPPETHESRWAKLSGIPEEYINLNESIMDTTPMEDLIGDMAGEIADRLGNEMKTLWDEDPEMMRERYTTVEQWNRQVGSAEMDLEDMLQQVMKKAVEDIEAKLHGGDYYDDRENPTSMVAAEDLEDTAGDEALVLPNPYNQPRDAYRGDKTKLTPAQWIERQKRKIRK